MSSTSRTSLLLAIAITAVAAACGPRATENTSAMLSMPQHQATTLTREGSVADVLLDGAAAAAALAVAALGIRPSADHVARLLLWAAAAGGTVLLAIDVAAAAPSGWLWLSVPAAWLTLWAWRRRRARA